MADWLQTEIITGLQQLFALRLPGAPGEDTIVGTAQVWLHAIRSSGIAWNQELDSVRIKGAFNALFRSCDRWPAPKQFLDSLGSRAPAKQLPKPKYPADKAKANLKRIRGLIGTARNLAGEGLKPPSTHTKNPNPNPKES